MNTQRTYRLCKELYRYSAGSTVFLPHTSYGRWNYTFSIAAKKSKQTDDVKKDDKKHFENLEALAVEALRSSPKTYRRKLEVNTSTESHDIEHVVFYGTPNKAVPMSREKCKGCGARLHCQDPVIKGYMPSEIFSTIPYSELKEHTCHRCTLMQQHNIALNLSIPPEEFDKVISVVKKKWALVIVVVDLTDIENSIYKGMKHLIGTNKPLYVVGNKADLLASAANQSSGGYLDRAAEHLKNICSSCGLITSNKISKHYIISAKTGYGVEDLITNLVADWNRKGDVYLVGSTNSGKSTLFNTLLSSDYCNERAKDLVSRATTSLWPGTTLNLLRFPIVKMNAWKLHKREKRLKIASIKEDQLEKSLRRARSNVSLLGEIGHTFASKKQEWADDLGAEGHGVDSAAGYKFVGGKYCSNAENNETISSSLDKRGKYNEAFYREGGWCYDTPGVISNSQVINLLTQSELSTVLSADSVKPRTFVIRQGQVMFIGGLARVDIVKCQMPLTVTTFTSYALPVVITEYSYADELYRMRIKDGSFKVPEADWERIMELPSLIGREFHFKTERKDDAVADICLSSIGWLTVSGMKSQNVTVRAYTPGALGIHLRQPPLLDTMMTSFLNTSAVRKRKLAEPRLAKRFALQKE